MFSDVNMQILNDSYSSARVSGGYEPGEAARFSYGAAKPAEILGRRKTARSRPYGDGAYGSGVSRGNGWGLSVRYEDAAEAPAEPSRQGYKFVGWNVVAGSNANDLTITAQYEAKKYQVGWNFGHSSAYLPGINETGIEEISWDDDRLIPSVNPVRPGYAFDHWELTHNGAVLDNTGITVTQDFTFGNLAAHDNVSYIQITARWVKKWTVRFVDWDGTPLKKQKVKNGSAATAPAGPSRTGYRFSGWDGAYDNIKGDTILTATYELKKSRPAADRQNI